MIKTILGISLIKPDETNSLRTPMIPTIFIAYSFAILQLYRVFRCLLILCYALLGI